MEEVMKFIAIVSKISVILLVILCLHSCTSDTEKVDDLYNYAKDHLNDLRLSTYITIGAIQNELDDPFGRMEAVSVLRSLGITKAYIETYRSGHVADKELLITIRDNFLHNGIEVAGGIATTPGKDFGVRQDGLYGWFNFQDPKTQADLEKVVRLTAQVFDEMIIDDFLCSDDKSDISNQAREERSWSQYRMDMMTDLAERLFIKPAREENHDITIIIKYPQWYDRFHMFGYDVPRESKLFDRVWIGTETRGPETRRMGYVQQYEGFVNFRWIRSFSPEKIGGAWFDHIDCNGNDFIDQAYMSVLAGAKEIIFFNYLDLMTGHPGHHLLRRQYPILIDLARMVRQQPVKGVYGYKPPYSDPHSNHYIMDYMGMIGVPLIPASSFPSQAEVIFLPIQAAKDGQLLAHITNAVDSGKTLILTSGLLNILAENQELFSIVGIKSVDSTRELLADKVYTENVMTNLDDPVPLPVKLNPSTANTLLSASQDGVSWPLLTVNTKPSGANVYVLNLRTFSENDFAAIKEVLLAPIFVSWMKMPTTILNTIRQAFTDPLGITLKVPGRVSLHIFGDNNWIVYNFNNEAVKCEISLSEIKNKSFKNQVTGESIEPNHDVLNLSIEKRSMLWITTQPAVEYPASSNQHQESSIQKPKSNSTIQQ